MLLPGWLRRRPRPTRARTPCPPYLEALEDRVVPTLMGNQLFPADNPWNQQITNAPVAANSAALVASIGLGDFLHADFGTTWNGALNGIPYNVVTGSQPKVNVVIDAYPDESDLQPIPIPANAVIEGDPLPSAQNQTDRHLLVYDQTNNILYETFNTRRPSETADGQWHADSEAVWNLNTDTFRPAGWTSADAAGLPILPGLVRPDEVLNQGKITHALRFTVPATDSAYVYPASHEAGVDNPALPRMGERFRLKASFDISSYPPDDQVILQALKDYGMIVADNGSPWFLSGAPSPLWSDDDLHLLGQVPGSAFEAVDLTPVVTGLAQPGGSTTGGTAVTINGLNFSGGAGMTQVFFGGTPATSVQVISDTQIVAVAPAHTAGTVAITVQSPYGTSLQNPNDQFTFSPPAPSAGLFEFAAASYRVAENAGSITITVSRAGGSAGSATVHYATGGGTAVAGVNYQPASGTLTFATGQTSATFTVPVLDDGQVRGDLTVLLTLGSPTGGAALGSPATATLTVREIDGTADQRFVAQVYWDLLQRAADPAGLAAWTNGLALGMSRTQVVQDIEDSPEHRAVLVQGLYQQYLGRPADPAGLTAWVNFLNQGGTVEQLKASLLGSDEFYARTAGGTPAGFVQALYQLLLNRPADAAAQVWTQALIQGVPRAAIALGIATSAEADANQVQAWYAQYLRRPADTVGLNYFVPALLNGMRDEQVIGILLGSDEYYLWV